MEEEQQIHKQKEKIQMKKFISVKESIETLLSTLGETYPSKKFAASSVRDRDTYIRLDIFDTAKNEMKEIQNYANSLNLAHEVIGNEEISREFHAKIVVECTRRNYRWIETREKRVFGIMKNEMTFLMMDYNEAKDDLLNSITPYNVITPRYNPIEHEAYQMA
jgi:hypothetical protein